MDVGTLIVEADKVADLVRGDRLEALYVLALSTGMRRSEILGLMVSLYCNRTATGSYAMGQHSRQTRRKPLIHAEPERNSMG